MMTPEQWNGLVALITAKAVAATKSVSDEDFLYAKRQAGKCEVNVRKMFVAEEQDVFDEALRNAEAKASDVKPTFTVAELSKALEDIAMMASGGLTSLGASAKGVQLMSIAKRCKALGFEVPALG